MRLKFHALVIAVITLILYGGYLLFAPAPNQTTLSPTEANIGELKIVSASWGLNCNELYAEFKARNDDLLKKDPNLQRPQGYTPPKLMTQNNALTKVSELCNGKEKCEFQATAELLGNDFSECSKDLSLSWRCFSYDKLHSTSVDGGKMVSINCAKP